MLLYKPSPPSAVLCFYVVPMLSNTDMYYIFLIRAMSSFHTVILHSHFFPSNWSNKFETKYFIWAQKSNQEKFRS